MNYALWGLGTLSIFVGLVLQWVFWTGFDLPELSSFGRKITFVRRTFTNVLFIAIGLVLFAIPAAHDRLWQLIALCAIIGFAVVVFLLATWDLIAMRWAMVRDRDRTYHRELKAEMERFKAEKSAAESGQD